MNISEKFRKLMQGIWASVGRFPVTVMFAVLLTVFSIVLNHVDYHAFSEKVRFFMYWYPATAMMLSLGLSLFSEERKCRIWVIAAHVVWAGIWVLMSTYENVIQKQPYVLVFAALIVLAVVSVVLLPFFGDKDDMPMWNFTLEIICTTVVALFVGLVLWGGLSLLLLSFEQLFGLHIDSDLYEDMAYVSFFLVAPMLVLQGIPSAQDKHDATPANMPGFIRGALLYLFIPLTVLYFITLYCYAVKIIVTWELPEGWVSYLVSASMILVVLLQLALRPFKRQEGYGRFAVRLVFGWLPKFMLPLLLLMSVGIARRVSDYGITVSRVYLIVFNLWCYAACLIMWLKKSDRVMWMPLSVVVLFIVLSVFPINVSTAVRDSMVRKVRKVMVASDWNGTAMSDDEYRTWLAGLDSDTAFKVDSRMDYLKTKYTDAAYGKLLVRGVLTGKTAKEKSDERSLHLYCNGLLENTEVAIPAGKTTAVQYSWNGEVKENNFSDDRLTVTMDGQNEITVTFPMADLRALHADEQKGLAVYAGTMADGRPCTLYLNTFWLHVNGKAGSMHVNGLLFY